MFLCSSVEFHETGRSRESRWEASPLALTALALAVQLDGKAATFLSS
jgi:hypothetical protein